MIEFNKYSSHSFLSPVWCKRLRKAGIDMKNAVWFIVKIDDIYYVVDKDELVTLHTGDYIPTYTLTDMLYMLNEYPYVGNAGAPLDFVKDAPFYVWAYYFNHNDRNKPEDLPKFKNGKSYVEAMGETPIEAAARMLLVCKNNGIHFFQGSFQDKYDEMWRDFDPYNPIREDWEYDEEEETED